MHPEWLSRPVKPLCEESRTLAGQHQDNLTKPPGSLGRMEEIAVRLAAMQGQQHASITGVSLSVFAGDHGVCAEGISAFPQVVTQEMIKNFLRGGAAISVLAKYHEARLEIINVGTIEPVDHPQLRDQRIAPGTNNFIHEAAMNMAQCYKALAVGAQAVERAKQQGANIVIGGEMGIGNTSSAAALAAAVLAQPARVLVGPGTGLDRAQIEHKVAVVQQALDLHLPYCEQHGLDIYQLMARLGGYEILALCGFYLAAAQHGLTILVDGFISSTAALLAHEINDQVRHWMIFSHESAEPGHRLILAALQAKPLLNLHMRLGEGSGAAVALSLVKQSLVLHQQMATFEQAQVSRE